MSQTNLDQFLTLFEKYLDFYKCPFDFDRAFSFFSDRLKDSAQFKAFLYKDQGFVSLYYRPSSLRLGLEAYMSDLFVSPQSRKKGIGGALINHVSQVAKKDEIPLINWFTARDNKEAINLYRSLGAKESDWLNFGYSHD